MYYVELVSECLTRKSGGLNPDWILGFISRIVYLSFLACTKLATSWKPHNHVCDSRLGNSTAAIHRLPTSRSQLGVGVKVGGTCRELGWPLAYGV